jgi:hypothetical protein
MILCPFSWAQSLSFASRVMEYNPAPGQYINDPAAGTPSAALNILNHAGNPLSLGAYGGYVVLGFNSAIVNDPENPYGIDFIIYGNATATHAEPGIVKVMRDENKNGIPDDTWYEIAGSEHFTGQLENDYSIEYINPKTDVASDVQWIDNLGNTGKVHQNSFHKQPYYPLNEFFPGISNERLNFSGSKLKGNVLMRSGIFVSLPYTFGYADNKPVINPEITGIPDNPYTFENVEGDGGDGIDLSWAVDSQGNYADLQEIDFVMVYTAVNQTAGWLGEISTDIRGIADVEPNPGLKGQMKMIIIDEFPQKIALSDTLTLTSRVFLNGRPVAKELIQWETKNPSILHINGNVISTEAIGLAEIKGTLVSDPSIFISKKIVVTVPEKLITSSQTLSVQEGESFLLNYSLVDNTGEPIKNLIPVVIVGNENVAGVFDIKDGVISVKGKAKGLTFIQIDFPGFPELSKTIEVNVIRKIDPIQIVFSLGNENGNMIPGKKYEVEKRDIQSFTDRYQKMSHPDKPFFTLADGIVSALLSEGFGSDGKSLVFRQDEYGGEGLYLWLIGFDWEYQYGWGGSKKDDAHSKTWFAIVNNRLFVSGFDTIEIQNGDRISLCHIEDIRNPWSIIRITAENDRITTGEIINFRSEQLDFYPGEDNDFTISGPFPVVNSGILIEPSVINNNSDQYTSYTGEFSLSFKQAGFHRLALENSEPIILEVLNPLSVRDIQTVGVYPNPCYDFLTVTIPNGEFRKLRLYGSDGKLRFQTNIENTASDYELNLSGFEAGVYVLELVLNDKVLKQKISKF